MTEPDDDTKPHATDLPAPDPVDGDPTTIAEPGPAGSAASPGPGRMPGGPLGAPAAPPPPPSTLPPPATPPPLAADPDRPADSGWREPPWIPARKKDRRPSPVALIVGLGLIAVGLWFFLDRTLGVDLPRIEWRGLWPIVLIVVGAIVLIRSLNRGR